VITIMVDMKKIIESLAQIIRSLDFAGIALDRARREGSMHKELSKIPIPNHYRIGGCVSSGSLDIRRAKDGFENIKAELRELRNLKISQLVHECENLFMRSAFFTEEDCDKVRLLQLHLGEIKAILLRESSINGVK